MRSRGYARLAVIGLLSVSPIGYGAHISASAAALADAADGTSVMASFFDGGRAWFLTESNESVQTLGGRSSVTTLTLIGVRRRGLGWASASTRFMERSGDFPTNSPGAFPDHSFVAAYPNLDYPDYPAYTKIPEACAFPRVAAVPYDEIMYNCWIAQDSLYVIVAPKSAHEIDIDFAKTTQRFALAHPGEMTLGLIRPTTAVASAIRFGYRDGSGRLLDAVPSWRVALGWYPAVAAAAGATYCVNPVLSPPSECGPKGQTDPNGTLQATVALSLLSPSEFRETCGAAPPPGDWVLVGNVVDGGIGLSWDQTRSTLSGVKQYEVIAGVNGGGEFPTLNSSTLRARRGRPCFTPYARQS